MELLIFITAVINGILLAAIFSAQLMGKHVLVRRLGIAYLALAAPGAAALTMAITGGAAVETVIFLAIFLAYLFIEWLYDYALKLDFRHDWKLLIPYAALYFASCYGFFVMTWRQSFAQGVTVLAITALQIVLNMITHYKSK